MSRRRSRWLVGGGLCAAFLLGMGVFAHAQDVAFSASVDKTTVILGNPIQLTLTLTGDIAGAQLPPLELPEGFAVVGRSQSTNFSIHDGSVEQSVSLVYVLIPQITGTFDLGPFTVSHGRQQLKTSSISITVKKAPFRPRPELPGSRITI